MGQDSRLGGTPRTRINAQVRARTDYPVCPMCGYAIDRNAQRMGKRHPLASVIDEWLPRNPCRHRRSTCLTTCDPHAPRGAVTLTNCVELHDTCNSLKHDHWPVTEELMDRCRTTIERQLTQATPTLRTW